MKSLNNGFEKIFGKYYLDVKMISYVFSPIFVVVLKESVHNSILKRNVWLELTIVATR